MAALVAVAVAGVAAIPAVKSGANFNAQTANPGNTIAADSPSNYVHLYSQGSDPAGLTGYAAKLLAAPASPAATGTDATLGVQLGGYKNAKNVVANRAFTLQAPNPLPAAPHR